MSTAYLLAVSKPHALLSRMKDAQEGAKSWVSRLLQMQILSSILLVSAIAASPPSNVGSKGSPI